MSFSLFTHGLQTREHDGALDAGVYDKIPYDESGTWLCLYFFYALGYAI